MKVAVCVAGQTRTFNYCYDSFVEFFPNCDFFVHTYDYNAYHESWGVSIDSWDSSDLNLIKSLNPIFFKLESWEESAAIFRETGWSGDIYWRDYCKNDEYNKEYNHLIGPKMEDLNMRSMWHSIYSAYDHDFSEYDFVIKTRFDLIYTPGMTIYDIIKSIEASSAFFTDNVIHDSDVGFHFNDVCWVSKSSIANHIKKFDLYNNFDGWDINRKMYEHITSITDIKNYCKEEHFGSNFWKIIRPRFVKLNEDWRKLYSYDLWLDA